VRAKELRAFADAHEQIGDHRIVDRDSTLKSIHGMLVYLLRHEAEKLDEADEHRHHQAWLRGMGV